MRILLASIISILISSNAFGCKTFVDVERRYDWAENIYIGTVIKEGKKERDKIEYINSNGKVAIKSPEITAHIKYTIEVQEIIKGEEKDSITMKFYDYCANGKIELNKKIILFERSTPHRDKFFYFSRFYDEKSYTKLKKL